MKNYFFIFYLSLTFLQAGYNYSISPITPNIKKRMIKGDSWRKGCPVGLADLRYIRLSYHDFTGKTKEGELIIHKDAAKDIVEIFNELYMMKYPVRGMKLVSDFGGNDWKSIEADNTSAFNCRPATGSKNWSKHAYGKAIDLNPIENPYVSKSGRIAHKASQKYRKRAHSGHNLAADKALLLKNDKATEIFKKHRWKWGGEWREEKDYQHFFKP